MAITFKGGYTNTNISIDFNKKTYTIFSGVGSGSVRLATQKELKDLEIQLISNGFKKVGE